MRTLGGKRVLITGAASGLGRAMAERFAREGAQVLLTDIDGTRLEQSVVEMRAAGHDVRAYTLDVTDADAILALRGEVHDDGGPIDALVNNAGVVFGGTFLDVALDRHVATLEVNLRGPVMLTHAFLPDLLSRPDAHIVNVASMVGLVGAPGAATYAASKWGVVGLSESLELELRRAGATHVHVTTVCPGLISTDLFAGAGAIRLVPRQTADQVADQVVRAVLRDAHVVRTPTMVRLIPALRAALPHRAFNRLIDALGGNAVMDHWTGRVPPQGVREAEPYNPASV